MRGGVPAWPRLGSAGWGLGEVLCPGMLNLNSVCCAQGFPGNLGLDRGNCEVGVPSAEAEGLLDHYGIAVPFEAGPSWQRSRCPVSVWVSEVVKWGWSSGSGAGALGLGPAEPPVWRVLSWLVPREWGMTWGTVTPMCQSYSSRCCSPGPLVGSQHPETWLARPEPPPNPHRDGRVPGCAGCLLAALPQPRPKRCRPTGPEP